MSDFITKQVDAKAKAWHEAKELIDSVEARGGVWSGEDEAKYASLTADINKRNELIELEQFLYFDLKKQNFFKASNRK